MVIRESLRRLADRLPETSQGSIYLGASGGSGAYCLRMPVSFQKPILQLDNYKSLEKLLKLFEPQFHHFQKWGIIRIISWIYFEE